MSVTATARVVRFADFEADFKAGELRRAGLRIKLQDQPMRLLGMLLEYPGEPVTREEIHQKLWPTDTFVDFDHGLNNAVNRLREALGDSADHPRYIETLPRRGYRFIGAIHQSRPVEALQGSTPGALPAAHKHRVAKTALAVAATLVLVLVIWELRLVRSREASSPLPIRSLAVLPFENLSGDPSQEYLADGMTDLLITQMAQIGSLRVVSRSSAMHYKNSRKALPEIARELGVQAVVEGSIVRSGNQVRINAQLVRASPDLHLWAKTYEGQITEPLAVQSEIAGDIVNAVQVRLTPVEALRLKPGRQVDPAAQEAYLQGLYLWNQFSEQGLRGAIAYFNKAIQKEPSFAPAYVGLADAYHELAIFVPAEEVMPKSKEACQKALQLDPNLGGAHATLGWVKWLYDWDWAGAEAEFRRAVELGGTNGHGMYAEYLDAMGRFDEASRERAQARELDPVAPILLVNTGEHFIYLRQYDKAVEEFRKVLETQPDFALAHLWLARAYTYSARHKETVEELALFYADDPALARMLRSAYRKGGYQAAIRSLLQYQQMQRLHGAYVPFRGDAANYLQLGDKDRALDALQKAYAAREDIVELAVDPTWDAIRDDARFQAMVRKMGLSAVHR